MEITVERPLGKIVLIRLAGVYDISEIFRFETAVTENTDSDTRVLALDFSELVFIDSSAISSLIRMKNKVSKDGIQVLIIDIQDDILNMFKLAYLDRFFTLIPRADFLKYVDEER